jgi:hypothetical protein
MDFSDFGWGYAPPGMNQVPQMPQQLPPGMGYMPQPQQPQQQAPQQPQQLIPPNFERRRGPYEDDISTFIRQEIARLKQPQKGGGGLLGAFMSYMSPGGARAADYMQGNQEDAASRNNQLLKLMLAGNSLGATEAPKVQMLGDQAVWIDDAGRVTPIPGFASAESTPSGFERAPGGGLTPIKGGPADPDYLRSKPDRQNVPAGYEYDAEKGKLVPIPGGPASKLPQSAAGAVAMMDMAESEMKAVNAKETLLNMGHMSGDIRGFAGYGDVGRAQRAIRMAIEASLRLMTGAAAPASEVQQYTEMFTPQGMDGAETRAQKLRALEQFMSEARRNLLQGREPDGERGDGGDNDPLGIR